MPEKLDVVAEMRKVPKADKEAKVSAKKLSSVPEKWSDDSSESIRRSLSDRSENRENVAPKKFKVPSDDIVHQ